MFKKGFQKLAERDYKQGATVGALAGTALGAQIGYKDAMKVKKATEEGNRTLANIAKKAKKAKNASYKGRVVNRTRELARIRMLGKNPPVLKVTLKDYAKLIGKPAGKGFAVGLASGALTGALFKKKEK